MDKKKLGYLDVIVGTILLLVGIFMVIYAQKMPLLGPIYSSPGMFPTIIGAIMIVLATLIIIPGIRTELRRNGTDNQLTQFLKNWKIEFGFSRLIIVLVLLVAYIISLSYLNYVVATALYLFVMLVAFKATSITRALLITISSTGIVYYLFGTIFRIPLP